MTAKVSDTAAARRKEIGNRKKYRDVLRSKCGNLNEVFFLLSNCENIFLNCFPFLLGPHIDQINHSYGREEEIRSLYVINVLKVLDISVTQD